MNSTSQKISFVEKVGYSLGDLAANLVFQTLITYLAYFYTDIYGRKSTDASIVMLSVGLVAAFLFNPIIGVLANLVFQTLITHGRNFPQRELVRSANTPIIGLKRKAATSPTDNITMEASVLLSP
jgi:Na+/melibiose symporter-like transporter